jgi:hypothetical protein
MSVVNHLQSSGAEISGALEIAASTLPLDAVTALGESASAIAANVLDPAPVSIAGMGRSGTSMLAQMLLLCGLDLGPSGSLMAPSPQNPDGYWEHVGFVGLNDDLLEELGGAWDYPPALPSSWDTPRFAPYHDRARELIRQFPRGKAWGWKDPRTSLILPFWLQQMPQLRLVIAVRNPLEVAASLNRRNGTSRPAGIGLWSAYYERILNATQAEDRIVTHYDAHFATPGAEIRRLLAFLGLPASELAIDQCSKLVSTDLRHTHATLNDLSAAGIDETVIARYRALCDEAQWQDIPSRSTSPTATHAFPAASTAPVVPSAVAEGRAVAEPVSEHLDLTALQTALSVAEAKIRWLRDENQTLTTRLHELDEPWVQRWADLERSASWRIALTLRRARHAVAPPGSRREGLWDLARRRVATGRVAADPAPPVAPTAATESPGRRVSTT